MSTPTPDRRRGLPPSLAALAALGLSAPAARAATLTVTNTQDSGTGSLRQAVADAQAGDTVNFAVTGTITLTSGEINVTQPLTLAGPGASSLAVDGNGSSRVFEVSAASGTVALSGLTVQHGVVGALAHGAGLENDGNGASLAVTRCDFTDNGNSTRVFGGGLGNFGPLTVTDCVFAGNTTGDEGGGLWSDSAAGATVTGCVFQGNAANGGGGFYNYIGGATVADCVFAGNSATNYGGGFFAGDGAPATLTNCSFTANSAGGGGAFFIYDTTGTLTNDILYGDTAASGAEIYIFSGGTVTLTVADSDVQGGYAGTGNVDVDPLFVSAAAPYNLLLQPGSPALGVGTAGAPDFPAADITGAAWGSPPAAGAYAGKPASTRTGLATSGSPSAAGQSVTFTATVPNTEGDGITPVGTVDFFLDGSATPAAAVALDGSGQAAYGTSALTAGSHTVRAGFVADARFSASVSSALTQTVLALPTADAQTVSVPFNTATGVTLTGSDPNSPARRLTYAVTTQPQHGTLSGTAPGLTYTPIKGYNGSDSFTFTVSNGPGTSAPATVTLHVAAGVPTANAQSVSVPFGTATGLTLTGSDPDVPALPLTYSLLSNPAHGRLTGLNAGTGAVTYTPSAGYVGSDSFTFAAKNGTSESAPATVSLTVASPTVSGTVTLSGWLGTGEPTPQLAFTLTPSGQTSGGTVTTLTPVPTSAAPCSTFTFALAGVTPGSYTLGVKGALWLREDAAVNVSTASASGANVTLPPGDVSGDNVVDGNDTALLRLYFNTVSGRTGFNAGADLNGDGVVDGNDTALLRADFNTVGRPY